LGEVVVVLSDFMLPSLRAASNQSWIDTGSGFGKEPIVVVCSFDFAMKYFLQLMFEMVARLHRSLS
jgi:hypothetical protein